MTLSNYFDIFIPCLALSIALYTFLSNASRFREFSKRLAIVVITQLVAVTLCSLLLLTERLKNVFPIVSVVEDIIRYAILILFIFSWCFLCYIFYKIYGSLYYMRDKRFVKYIWPISWIYDKLFHKKNYEIEYRERGIDNNSPIEYEWIEDIYKTGGSILLLYDEKKCSCSDFLANYILSTIRNKETVDYIATLKHPLEIPNKLSEIVNESEIRMIAQKISIIDCFTPYCAFDDRVLVLKKQELIDKGFCFYEADSFACIHTMTNTSWYRFRDQLKNQENTSRIPHRTIFNTLSELIRFSSEEQYLLYLKHVISSEKAYGMITTILEPNSLKEELKSELYQLTDVVIELSERGLKLVNKRKEFK